MQFPTTRAVLHQSAVAAADGAIMDVSGCSTVGVQIQGVTTATITWKLRLDGVNWVTVPGKNKANGVEATTATADGIYDIPCHGATEFIADITAWTSGTITITAVGTGGGVQSPHTSVAAVVGAVDTELPVAAALADNTANPTVPGVGSFCMVWDGATWDRMPGTSAAGTKVQPATGGAGAVDATTSRVAIATDANAVTFGASSLATYAVAAVGLAPAATATDIFEIAGSGTKTIKVWGIQISGTATAAGAYDIVVLKRSTANTGGTSTTPALVTHDSNDAAATAVVKAYTVNPTTGTLVGNVKVVKATVTTAAGAIPNVPTFINFAQGAEKPIVLRGVAQSLCINLNGVTMTGGSLDIHAVISEE